MSTHLTNPTQSSSLADKQTNMFTLPSPEHLHEESEICRDVCKNSCIQSEGGCTGKLNKVATEEHAQLRKGEGYVGRADLKMIVASWSLLCSH
jgi:MinD superfamily P-loop ATPase